MTDLSNRERQMQGMRHGAEVLANYLDEHDPDTLFTYADRLGNGAVFERLGFTLEALGTNLPDTVQACRDQVTAGVSALDPDGPTAGKIVTRWGLRVNATVPAGEPA